MDCSVCQRDPELKSALGCETPLERPICILGDDEFYQCPYKWVTDELLEWYEEYRYSKKFNCCIPYDRQTARFIDAIGVFDRWENQFLKEKNNHG